MTIYPGIGDDEQAEIMEGGGEMLKPGTDYVIISDLSLKEAHEVNPNLSVIGGFHTLCADVGEIFGHPLSGFRAGDPLPSSLWNLNHRAKCGNNSGMIYNRRRDLWVDIYLYSDSQRNINNQSLDDYEDIIIKIGKRLPTHKEFSSLAKGSNKTTNIINSKFHSITGGNKDTRGRRMISNIGCEDCAGLLWQWLSTIDKVDKTLRLFAGGGWSYSSGCGSRARFAADFRWSTFVGARFVSEPLNPRGRARCNKTKNDCA